jgi:hypothetical protein
LGFGLKDFHEWLCAIPFCRKTIKHIAYCFSSALWYTVSLFEGEFMFQNMLVNSAINSPTLWQVQKDWKTLDGDNFERLFSRNT